MLIGASVKMLHLILANIFQMKKDNSQMGWGEIIA